VTGGTWVACGEENVTSKKVKQSFTADELKIGDYFYSDGTWSDGGLRKIYTDGSMKIASPKPAPVLQTKSEIERRVIGIVFQTDPSRIGTAEKSKLGEGNVHGLVMALKNTATDIQWSHEENNLEDVKDCWSKSEIYSDISGLHNYTKILDHANSIGGIEAYPAFEAVEKWNDMYSINEYRPPRNTTGWFIPSSGQWWDILQNLGGCPAMADKGQQTSSDSGDFRWLGQGDVPAALNAWMNKIAADSKNDFTTGIRRGLLTFIRHSRTTAQILKDVPPLTGGRNKPACGITRWAVFIYTVHIIPFLDGFEGRICLNSTDTICMVKNLGVIVQTADVRVDFRLGPAVFHVFQIILFMAPLDICCGVL
jgi:hypothetical protein